MAGRDDFLVSTDWLASSLGRFELRILECTVLLLPRDDGQPGYAVVSGRDGWAAGHIPGAGFADIPYDLSDRVQPLRFMMPGPEQFAAAMGAYGIGPDSDVSSTTARATCGRRGSGGCCGRSGSTTRAFSMADGPRGWRRGVRWRLTMWRRPRPSFARVRGLV